jgi:adenosylhomocysteine nucleosidase
LDADGLTFACAMTVEERIARRLGPTALVGLGASRGVPEGRLVSFGIAGALSPDLPVGTVIDATRVVDESGAVLWEGGPLGAASARTGTILGASRIVDDPAERARLHAATGAQAVDMESGPLARSGRLAGCLRAVSDTPTRRLGGVAQGATPEGEVDALGFLRGFVREPLVTLRALFGARRALKSLEALAA